MTDKRKRIGTFTATAMVVVAVLFDIIEILLVFFGGAGLIVNRGIVSIKWFIYWFWFKMHDVSFTRLDSKGTKRKLLVASTTFLIGFIPLLGALPEFTLGIIIMIILVRAEDKIGISTDQIAAAAKGNGRTLSRKAAAEKTVASEEGRMRTLNREKVRLERRRLEEESLVNKEAVA